MKKKELNSVKIHLLCVKITDCILYIFENPALFNLISTSKPATEETYLVKSDSESEIINIWLLGNSQNSTKAI